MELNNEFRVDAPVSTAWTVLTDLERIAPCMPGAQLEEVDGEEYRGVVKVKVGPITAQYKGKATFLERDESAGRVILRAEGRDTRGQGNANATITATMVPDGDGTKVTVATDLTVTGKVAQFGRGVLAEVSAKLLDQFVACLETDVLAAAGGGAPHSTGDAAPTDAGEAPPSVERTAVSPAAAPQLAPNGPGPRETAGSTVRRIEGPAAAPVDLLDAAGGSIAKRAAPALAGLVGLLLVVIGWRRRRARRRR
ncbi:MAG TPA: SRPBCC family protein [Acidimicrobiales bacterium]|nr:SRPBCC family protein [Acidimicrobiales bacterium]